MRRGTVYPFLGVSRGHRVETLREYSSDEELFDIQPRNLWPDSGSPEPLPPSPEQQPGTATTPVCPPFEIFRDPDVQDEVGLSSSQQHIPYDQYPPTPVNTQHYEHAEPYTFSPSSRPPLGELQPSPEYPPEEQFDQIVEQDYEEEDDVEEEVLPSTPVLDQMYPGVFDDHDSPTEEDGLVSTPPPPNRPYRSPLSDQGYHHGSSPARSPGSVNRGYTAEMVTCTQQLPQGFSAATPIYTTINSDPQPVENLPPPALNAPSTSAPPSPGVYGTVSMPNPFATSSDEGHMPSFHERQQRKEEAKSRLGVVVRGIKIPRPSDILDYSDGPTTFGPRALWTHPTDGEVDHYAIGPSPPTHGRNDAAEYHIYDQFEDEEYDAEYEEAQNQYDAYAHHVENEAEEHVEQTDVDQSYYGDHEYYDDDEIDDDEIDNDVYDDEDKENHPTAEQIAECHMSTPHSRRLFGHSERIIGRRIGHTYDSIEPSPTMVERAIILGVFLAPKVKRRAGRFECKRDHSSDPPAEARMCIFFDNCWGERQPIVGLACMRGRWILDEPEEEAEDAEGRVDKIRRVGKGPHRSKLLPVVEVTPSSLNSPSSSSLPQLSFSCSTLDSSVSSSFVDENPPWSLREDPIVQEHVDKHQLLPPSLRSSKALVADGQDAVSDQ
ncbi:MAG: hypothetical protein BYD32DRAFT_418862 [Podila humilis]|nr:MAG: hypothetical protein BYD32DRAFT_418862 [Podila humilis]